MQQLKKMGGGMMGGMGGGPTGTTPRQSVVSVWCGSGLVVQ